MSADARAHRSGRVLRFLGGGCLLAVVLVAVSVVVVAGRVLLYRQGDDTAATARKETYLATLRRSAEAIAAGARPNVVVILFDDLGLGDLGSYGSRAIATPHLDRLAAEGVLFRQAYAVSPYCSASRAGLLTGRYPARMGLDHVVQAPGTITDLAERFGGLNRRLPTEEITLAEILQAAGYATAAVGKWHLGDASPSLPNDRGFDRYYGLLHSNDQGEPVVWRDRRVEEEHPIDQSTLTRRYTAEAVRFIEENRERPFFLYLAHTFPHIPLHVAADRLGTSAGGLYGDVVEELDWSSGEILATLERLGLDERTLVVVTSDNGPWYQGSPGGLRGRKFDVFEGGFRVPFLTRWPERIAAGQVCDEIVTGLDLVPTVLAATSLPEPPDRFLDGGSFLDLVASPAGERARSGERAFYYYQLGKLRAVRRGRFKLHDRHAVFFGNPMNWPWAPTRLKGPWLFDLESDDAESWNVSARYPAVERDLSGLLVRQREASSSNPRGWR